MIRNFGLLSLLSGRKRGESPAIELFRGKVVFPSPKRDTGLVTQSQWEPKQKKRCLIECQSILNKPFIRCAFPHLAPIIVPGEWDWKSAGSDCEEISEIDEMMDTGTQGFGESADSQRRVI